MKRKLGGKERRKIQINNKEKTKHNSEPTLCQRGYAIKIDNGLTLVQCHMPNVAVTMLGQHLIDEVK